MRNKGRDARERVDEEKDEMERGGKRVSERGCSKGGCIRENPDICAGETSMQNNHRKIVTLPHIYNKATI